MARFVKKIKDLFLSCCKLCMGNGKKTRFWEDRWLGNEKMSLTFPRLYSISQDQHITVHDALSEKLATLSFRRALLGEKAEKWSTLVLLCDNVSLSDSEDKLSWLLASSGVYSVKSFYSAM